MLASSGEITDPCPVPLSLTATTPSSRMPALSHFWIRRMMRRSPIRCEVLGLDPGKRISHCWLTESKKDRMSASRIQLHLLAGDADHQCVQRIVLTALGPEPIREPEEILLVDRVQQCAGRPLDDFVFQGGYRERALSAI